MAKSNMGKYERICQICGEHYYYCTHGCSEFAKLPKYMDTFDKENCRDLYQVCAGFVNKWLSDDQEIARLKSLDLSYVDKLPDWMQDAIKEMQRIDDENSVKAMIETETKDEPVVAQEDVVIEEISEDKNVINEEADKKPEVNDEFTKSERKANTKSNKPRYYSKNKY